MARAAELIAPQYGTRDGHKTEWENYWEYRYLPRHPKGWRKNTRIGWGVSPPYVVAGIYFDSDTGPFTGTGPLWIADIEADDTKPWEIGQGKPAWVGKTQRLDQVVRDHPGSVEEQAQAITEFVLAPLNEIEVHRPKR